MLKPKTQINNLQLKIVRSLVFSLDLQMELEHEKLYRETVGSDNQYFILLDMYFGALDKELKEEIHFSLYDILARKVQKNDPQYPDDLGPETADELVDKFIKKYGPLLITL